MSSRDQDQSQKDRGGGEVEGGEDLNKKSRSDRGDDHDESSHYKRHKVSSRNAHSRHEGIKGQERMPRIDEYSSSFYGEGGGGVGPEIGESSNTASRRPRPRHRHEHGERSNVGSRYHDDNDNDNNNDDMQEPPSRYSSESSSSSASSRLRPSERSNAGRYHDDNLVRARSNTPSPSRGHGRGFERVPAIDDQLEDSRSRQGLRQSGYYYGDDDGGWPEERSGPARIPNRLLSEDGSGMTDAEIDDCLGQLDGSLPIHLHRTERSRGTISTGKEKGKEKGKGLGKGKGKAKHHGK